MVTDTQACITMLDRLEGYVSSLRAQRPLTPVEGLVADHVDDCPGCARAVADRLRSDASQAALGPLPPDALDRARERAAVRALGDGEPAVRRSAIAQLARGSLSADARAALGELAARDPDASVRQAAVAALDPRPVPESGAG